MLMLQSNTQRKRPQREENSNWACLPARKLSTQFYKSAKISSRSAKRGSERVQNAKAMADEYKRRRLLRLAKRMRTSAWCWSKLRELEKKRKLTERMEIIRIQKELERYGVNYDEAELTAMDKDARALILLMPRRKLRRASLMKNDASQTKPSVLTISHVRCALRVQKL